HLFVPRAKLQLSVGNRGGSGVGFPARCRQPAPLHSRQLRKSLPLPAGAERWDVRSCVGWLSCFAARGSDGASREQSDHWTAPDQYSAILAVRRRRDAANASTLSWLSRLGRSVDVGPATRSARVR